NRDERRPCSSMHSSSPGSTSRTTLAPTMSRAAVSDATTQPRSSRPSTSGRTPCGSRAAYTVVSSMKTSENAPRSLGSTSSDVAGQRLQRRLVEHLRDQAELLVDDDRRAVTDRHARGLLAPVLQRVHAEVGELGDGLAGRPHAEDAACVLGGLLAQVVQRVER